jgi:1-acyl-sn-glycerol-3-phosphate acyltransferase
MIGFLLSMLADLEVEGTENIPKEGPIIVAANHFSFLDAPALIHIVPRHLEFLGGNQMPNGPSALTWTTRIYGYYPVFRGTASRGAMKAAESVMKQHGFIGIFPEGGSWTTVLRPARPGAAFIAARTGARILPLGMDGLTEVFPKLRKGERARVVFRFGKPIGPFEVDGRGRERREQLDDIGHQIMRGIAELLPPEQRGFYSDDPEVREAAKGSEIFPWDTTPEV